jgi:hypothetical protein
MGKVTRRGLASRLKTSEWSASSCGESWLSTSVSFTGGRFSPAKTESTTLEFKSRRSI